MMKVSRVVVFNYYVLKFRFTNNSIFSTVYQKHNRGLTNRKYELKKSVIFRKRMFNKIYVYQCAPLRCGENVILH